ncbi:MAG: hypothetical protein HQ534_10785 [Armatimonadetes bacterium]|nr:hypothetical protein [Armatimonadota bacterium]
MKKTSLVLGFMLIMLLAMSTSLMAITFTVTSINDTGSETATEGKLSWAITQSNISPSDDDIVFDLDSGSTVTISGALPTITDAVTIDGDDGGTAVTVQVTTPGTSTYRVFNINASDKTVNISNMTIKGGDISEQSGENSYGGSIYIKDASVYISNCTITGSKAAYGGAILVNELSGPFSLNNSTVSNSIATFKGGGYVYSIVT